MARVSIMNMLTVFSATTMLIDMGVAVDITVGSPNGGWDLSTDLATWVASQTFFVVDNLNFQFTSTHDVLEVTKLNYDSCGLGSPISATATSPARFPLTDAGSRYFICGPQCSQGMKVQIDVSLKPSPPPPQITPPPSATPPSLMPPPQSTPPSPTPTPSETTAPTPAPTPTPTQTTPPSPTPTPQTTPPSSPNPPANDPSGSSPPPPITGGTADPPSSAVTLKMTAGSILGLGSL